MLDFLIVGSGGLYGATCARQLTDAGKKVLVIDKRPNIAGKWFQFGKDVEGNDLPKKVISREYSSEWKPGDEPYYPVNDQKNGELYQKYKELADQESNVIFGGRLGEYKYYDRSGAGEKSGVGGGMTRISTNDKSIIASLV